MFEDISEETDNRTPIIKREHESFSTIPESDYVSRSSRESSWTSSQTYGTHIGYTTELEPILFDISQTTGVPSASVKYQKPDGHNGFLLQEPGALHSHEPLPDILSSIEQLVHPHGPALVRDFQNTINRSFPVIGDAFFKAYASHQMSSVDPTLLAAIYTLAVSNSNDFSLTSSSNIDVEKLEDVAFEAFSLALTKPTLSTIQAGILLMQRPHVDSRTLNTQVVGVAYELGFHLDCSSWNLSDEERSSRKMLAWALYMQDKWCSLIHGRPSLISKEHWAVKELTEDDYQDSSESSLADSSTEESKRGREMFSEMVVLTEILSTILDTFYTLKAMQEFDEASENSTRIILERAKPVQIRLKDWFTRLPTNLKMDNTTTGKPLSTGKPPWPACARFAHCHRASTPSLLCNRNYAPSLYHPLSQLHRFRYVPLSRMSIRSKNAPHFGHGLCQPPSSGASCIILVLSFQSQLCPHWYFRQFITCNSSWARGSRFLSYPSGRIQVDALRQQQVGRVPRLRRRLVGFFIEFIAKPSSKTVHVGTERQIIISVTETLLPTPRRNHGRRPGADTHRRPPYLPDPERGSSACARGGRSILLVGLCVSIVIDV